MENLQLTRLEGALERLLDKHRRLAAECSQLRHEKTTWQLERQQLLGDVEKILRRLDDLQLEEP
jgi:FtsZ-binding cell division protein ZapB